MNYRKSILPVATPLSQQSYQNMPIGIPIPSSQQSPYVHASSAYRQYDGNMQVEYQRLRHEDNESDDDEDEEDAEDAEEEKSDDDNEEVEKEMDEEEEEVNVVVTALARGQLTALLGGPAVPSSIPPCWGDHHTSIADRGIRIQIIKQQQQRLLLLRHASKCPQNGSYCPVSPHCASMKQLFKHVTLCQDQDCKQPHCLSSRFVLSHYATCMDQACPVCKPTREANRMNLFSTPPPPTSRPTTRRAQLRPTVREGGEWIFALRFYDCWSRYKASSSSASSTS